MTTKEVLIEAKALLTPEKWDKGVAVIKGSSRLCAGMAIDVVTAQQSEQWQAAYRVLLEGARVDVVFGLTSAVIRWNDTHTYEEVLEGFDKAIALAAEEESSDEPPA